MTDIWDSWDDAEEKVREALVWASGLIKDEEVSGLVFGVSLVLTDHLFAAARELASLVRL